MSAAEACPGHFLPKKGLGRRPLQGCSSRKRENIVLIEVDSDDFGDVIILDVPESFHKKFRKRPKHVISIDDDDENISESRNAACNPNGDAAANDRCSPTSVAHSLNSAEVDVDSVTEENTPVKLCKSKRTYSGTNISRNRYGLSSESTCSSDDDCSDCEFMGNSSEMLYEQWKKAPSTHPHDNSTGFPENKAGSSAPNQPVHNSTEESILEHSEPPRQQSNFTNCSLNHDRDTADGLSDLAQKLSEGTQFCQMETDPTEMSGHFERKHDSCNDYSHSDDKIGDSVPGCPVYQTDKLNTYEVPQPSNSRGCFDHEKKGSFNDSAKEVPEQCDSTDQDDDAEEMSDVFVGDASANIKVSSDLDAGSTSISSYESEQGAGMPSSLLEGDSTSGHEARDSEANSSDVQSCIITDRQKIKETDEYQRAMEEEWESRKQQLQIQAEEARRLRDRKRAENMRIKANERRQLQRLEEVRETRRKDEENLNLKEQLRVGIRKELRRIEMICGDMSSLLRCLGIQIGSLYPSPNEVQAAYKRACLKFHPDRFAKCDLRQQVEAEEKFKLISNMKEKLLFR